MSLFIETICIKDAQLRNIEFHQKRMDEVRKKHFPNRKEINLNKEIIIPKGLSLGRYKLRIVYGQDIKELAINKYHQKVINQFLIKEIDPLFDYSEKSLNRAYLDSLINENNVDDLILVQNGNVTDATYANLIFYDGENWVTPKNYLLNGTMRSYLLSANQIVEKKITIKDLKNYKYFKRVNAMMNIEESQQINL